MDSFDSKSTVKRYASQLVGKHDVVRGACGRGILAKIGIIDKPDGRLDPHRANPPDILQMIFGKYMQSVQYEDEMRTLLLSKLQHLWSLYDDTFSDQAAKRGRYTLINGMKALRNIKYFHVPEIRLRSGYPFHDSLTDTKAQAVLVALQVTGACRRFSHIFHSLHPVCLEL